MNYIGSKSRLSSWIKEEITDVFNADLSDKIFCDIFAGTGIIGRTFKGHVKKIISNDFEYYSFVLNKNYISNRHALEDKEYYLEYLNTVPLVRDGFIYQHYCLGGGSGRQYFSDTNGMKIDAIRQQINRWFSHHEISEEMYYFLLASLIESADKVANTASIYGAYLKHLKKSAQQELRLQPAHFEYDVGQHEVYHEDANVLIKKISGDILYLDPPYNERQYSANYHILNTIALYDHFIPRGKTGLRGDFNKSNYCRRNRVHRSFEALIKNAQFPYIFLSYNNEGLMHKEDVSAIMSRYGTYDLVTTEYKRFKADQTLSRNHKASVTKEYLHILKK
ncbi:DNA adenine methylase [Sulfurospirillum sp. 1612]|uniref:DNA adenine methylase n=1 Tax=Sulfurospirillum sp. 1612 TaxID=3094835 RepID=UPI002F927CDF